MTRSSTDLSHLNLDDLIQLDLQRVLEGGAVLGEPAAWPQLTRGLQDFQGLLLHAPVLSTQEKEASNNIKNSRQSCPIRYRLRNVVTRENNYFR